MIKIAILGCGWLGFPLAKSLLQNQFLINGSTTSSDKIAVLKNAGIDPFLISANENSIEGNMSGFLENSEILIITIPPKLRLHQTENFVSKIKTIIPHIEKSSVKKVIFISSTSVFADNEALVTEKTKPAPETESGKQLLASENILLSNLNFKTTVVRFGGLIGNDRNPIKMLSGKTGIANPDAPINLIHQEDCISILQKIIATNSFGKTYNAVAPFHPSRKEYYTQKAVELHLPLPEFDTTKPSRGKTVLSDYLCADLEFVFEYCK